MPALCQTSSSHCPPKGKCPVQGGLGNKPSSLGYGTPAQLSVLQVQPSAAHLPLHKVSLMVTQPHLSSFLCVDSISDAGGGGSLRRRCQEAGPCPALNDVPSAHSPLTPTAWVFHTRNNSMSTRRQPGAPQFSPALRRGIRAQCGPQDCPHVTGHLAPRPPRSCFPPTGVPTTAPHV